MHEREESEKRVTGLWAVAVAVDNIKDAWQKKEKPTASHQSLHAQMHQIKMASTNHVHPRNSLSDFLSLSQTFSLFFSDSIHTIAGKKTLSLPFILYVKSLSKFVGEF